MSSSAQVVAIPDSYINPFSVVISNLPIKTNMTLPLPPRHKWLKDVIKKFYNFKTCHPVYDSDNYYTGNIVVEFGNEKEDFLNAYSFDHQFFKAKADKGSYRYDINGAGLKSKPYGWIAKSSDNVGAFSTKSKYCVVPEDWEQDARHYALLMEGSDIMQEIQAAFSLEDIVRV